VSEYDRESSIMRWPWPTGEGEGGFCAMGEKYLPIFIPECLLYPHIHICVYDGLRGKQNYNFVFCFVWV
jgi:hypothetical protein